MLFIGQNEDFRFLEIFAIVNPIENYIRAALGQFLFKNSEILGKHSFSIDTSFATMSDPLTPNLGFFVQAITQLTAALGQSYYYLIIVKSYRATVMLAYI